jgi:hypothetical protein
MKPTKWCNGPCGRELPRTEFYRLARSTWSSACKRCDNIRRRDDFKRAYYRGASSRVLYLRAQRKRRRLRAEIRLEVAA